MNWRKDTIYLSDGRKLFKKRLPVGFLLFSRHAAMMKLQWRRSVQLPVNFHLLSKRRTTGYKEDFCILP